ncbi:MAG: hypothetical protein ACPGES_11110, partial [Coraliomargarita sp.]
AKIEISVLGPDEQLVHSQELTQNIPIGGVIELTQVSVPLSKCVAPAKYQLVVRIDEFENDWDFWVYPSSLPAEASGAVHITASLDPKTVQVLESGGTVLWLPRPGRVEGYHLLVHGLCQQSRANDGPDLRSEASAVRALPHG